MDSMITVSHKQFKTREKTKNSKYLIVKPRKTKTKKNTYDVGRIMTHAHTRWTVQISDNFLSEIQR